jgi:HSP20 family protein
MALLFSDPFDALFQFQQALDQLRSSNWLAASPSGGGGFPPLNVFRKGDDVIIITEVPGVKREDLRIEAKGDTIRIAGTKRLGHEDEKAKGASIHRRERQAGRFDRAVTLPIQIDPEGIKAECRDGILALYLPRAEQDKPRSIPIN